jgi:hypothetical protein
MTLTATNRPEPTYEKNHKPCDRCGLIRQVRNVGRDSGLCADCRLVEIDLAAPPRIDDRCGTWAGWHEHRRVRGEKPCIDCAALMRDSKRVTA